MSSQTKDRKDPSDRNKKDVSSSKKVEKSEVHTNFTLERFNKYYHKHLIKIWIAIIVIPLLIFIIGTLVLPELFYDQIIWPYFWGTIEADAQDQSYGDVTEAYNPVNTIVYALVVIVVLYWLYKLFKYFKIQIDEKFIMAIIPFVMIGGVSRALEDAELFYAPAVYFFIAPIIYIFIGLVVIGFILLSASVVKCSKKFGLFKGIIFIGTIFVGLNIFYLVTYFTIRDQFSYFLHPIYPVVFSIIIYLVLWRYFIRQNRIELWAVFGSFGVWFLIINLLILFQWRTISAWNDAYAAVNPGKVVVIQPFAALLVIGLTFLCVGIVYFIIRLMLPKYPGLKPFILGVNLILFFSHFLDASATFIAIDYYDYVEKHVLPNFLIDVFQSAVIMFVLKGLLIVLVIYFLDILYKQDFKKYPTMIGLVKIAVLVLGLAPGCRDVLRLAIGV